MFIIFKQSTACELRISDWSSYVCSSDLVPVEAELELRFDRDDPFLGRDLARQRSEHRGLPCPGCPCDDHLLASPDGRSEELTQATVAGSQPLQTVQGDLHAPVAAKCDARQVADPRQIGRGSGRARVCRDVEISGVTVT